MRGCEEEGILELGLDGRRENYKNQGVAIKTRSWVQRLGRGDGREGPLGMAWDMVLRNLDSGPVIETGLEEVLTQDQNKTKFRHHEGQGRPLTGTHE